MDNSHACIERAVKRMPGATEQMQRMITIHRLNCANTLEALVEDDEIKLDTTVAEVIAILRNETTQKGLEPPPGSEG